MMSNDYLPWIGVGAYGLATLVASGLFIAALLASALGKGRKSIRFALKTVAVSLLFILTWVGQAVAPSSSNQSLAIAVLIVAPIVATIYGACTISCWRSERRQCATSQTATTGAPIKE